MNLQAVRGMNDLLPAGCAAWQLFEARARAILAGFGYQEIRTPHLEELALFARGIGETSDIVEKEMFTFEDSKGKFLALRPEGTAGVVRAAVEHGLVGPGQSLRLYYLGPMFRHERPQKGRYRQFHQLGAEALGVSSPQYDVEMVAIIHRLLDSFAIAGATTQINSLGCKTCRPAYREKLLGYLRQRQGGLCEKCRSRFERNPLRVFDCKSESCQAQLADAPRPLDFLCSDCAATFEAIHAALTSLGIACAVNPRIVRGLDYYTGFAFETYAGERGSQSAVAGGGRYDDLFSLLGGPPTPAVGFALGIERFLALAQAAPPRPGGLFCIPLGEKACALLLPLVEKLRRQGIACEVDWQPRSLKAKLKQADKSGREYALILGDSEVEQGTVILRNLARSSQETVPLSEIPARAAALVKP